MNKILTINQAVNVSQKLRESNKTIMLVGGCFDILHVGHIQFLNEAKKYADVLFLLLESDENIKILKGGGRPINTQKNRANILSALSSVNFIINLEGMTNNEKYDKLIVQIKPNFIAITIGDKNIIQREMQCKLVDAKLIKIKNIKNESSSKYINNLN